MRGVRTVQAQDPDVWALGPRARGRQAMGSWAPGPGALPILRNVMDVPCYGRARIILVLVPGYAEDLPCADVPGIGTAILSTMQLPLEGYE